jgi:hypothetical protein
VAPVRDEELTDRRIVTVPDVAALCDITLPAPGGGESRTEQQNPRAPAVSSNWLAAGQ